MQIRLVTSIFITGAIIIAVLVLVLMCSSNIANASDIDTTGCEEIEVDCAIPNQTKKIRGTDVHRNCWKHTYRLDCSKRSKNDCSKIPSDICAYISEECIDLRKEGDSTYCANLRRKYSCEKIIEYEEEKEEILNNGQQADAKDLLCKSLCLDGSCVKKVSIEENDELAKSVGMLNGLAQAKKGIDQDIKELVNVFKGETRSCSYHPLSFMNCCRASPSGWGEAIKLGKCEKDELDLAKARSQKRCVEVGEYCETKVLGACVDKRKVLCCYDSVIARTLNQAAKKQLDRNFGDPKNPRCEGLSLDDLKDERLDLSEADFTDFYEQIVVPNIDLPDVQTHMKKMATDSGDIASESSNAPSVKKGFSQKTLEDMPE